MIENEANKKLKNYNEREAVFKNAQKFFHIFQKKGKANSCPV